MSAWGGVLQHCDTVCVCVCVCNNSLRAPQKPKLSTQTTWTCSTKWSVFIFACWREFIIQGWCAFRKAHYTHLNNRFALYVATCPALIWDVSSPESVWSVRWRQEVISGVSQLNWVKFLTGVASVKLSILEPNWIWMSVLKLSQAQSATE